MVAVIGVLVIVTLVAGAIIGSQALATTLSAAAEQQDVGSAMHGDCPDENHDTHYGDMHQGSDTHHSGMHRH